MFRIDISDVLAAEKEALQELRGVRPAMAAAGRDAAIYSRKNHIYRNRTYRAQRSTQSVTEEQGGDVYTLVTIGVPYGSYLEGRGIAQLEDGVRIMMDRLGYFFAGLGSGIR